MDELDLGKLLREAMEEAFCERGHANVRTGVGRSTLINARRHHHGDFVR